MSRPCPFCGVLLEEREVRGHKPQCREYEKRREEMIRVAASIARQGAKEELAVNKAARVLHLVDEFMEAQWLPNRK